MMAGEVGEQSREKGSEDLHVTLWAAFEKLDYERERRDNLVTGARCRNYVF